MFAGEGVERIYGILIEIKGLQIMIDNTEGKSKVQLYFDS